MIKLFNKITAWLIAQKIILYRAIYLIITCFAAWLIFQYSEDFSSFGAALLIDAIAIALPIIWDKLTPDFDLLTELKNGNNAVGLAFVAYAIIIGTANIAAFTLHR